MLKHQKCSAIMWLLVSATLVGCSWLHQSPAPIARGMTIETTPESEPISVEIPPTSTEASESIQGS